MAAVARLNAAVVVTGTWLNLPWFMPFVYAGALKIGAWLLRDLRDLADWSLALLVGTTLLGLVAAGLTYLVAFGVMRRRWRRRRGAVPPKQEAA